MDLQEEETRRRRKEEEDVLSSSKGLWGQRSVLVRVRGGTRVGTMVSGLVSGSGSASRCRCSEAFGPPGGGLGRHWGSKAGEVLRAAHVGSLRKEKHNVVTWQNTSLAPRDCKRWMKLESFSFLCQYMTIETKHIHPELVQNSGFNRFHLKLC